MINFGVNLSVDPHPRGLPLGGRRGQLLLRGGVQEPVHHHPRLCPHLPHRHPVLQALRGRQQEAVSGDSQLGRPEPEAVQIFPDCSRTIEAVMILLQSFMVLLQSRQNLYSFGLR